MTITFEIRVALPVPTGFRWERVGDPYPDWAERTAQLALDEWIASHPQWYWELVKVQHCEEVMRFATPKTAPVEGAQGG